MFLLNLAMSVDALDSFLEGAGGSEEVMSWEGICEENFDLTHELSQDDEFVRTLSCKTKSQCMRKRR